MRLEWLQGWRGKLYGVEGWKERVRGWWRGLSLAFCVEDTAAGVFGSDLIGGW